MRILKTWMCVNIILQIFSCSSYALDAYYTKVDSGEPFEEYSRTGKYTDVIVRLNAVGRLVFWRGTSYLPKWETKEGSWLLPEVIERDGDGTERKPDRVNMFSYVRIIKNSSSEVVIHWRYLPTFEAGNPKGKVDHLGFVDEYFTIHSDGSVLRKIKQGTPKIDDWNDPLNCITQKFKLTSDGISNIETKGPRSSTPVDPVSGNAVLGPAAGAPVLHFKFDDAKGDSASDAISSNSYKISGHKSYWKGGVSGTALAFDGYNSGISIPSEQAPSLNNFTIDAWVSMGAYPWKWAPIIHQSVWGKSGYYLGVDARGRIGLKLKSGSWAELTTSYELPLMEWTHLAATYNGSEMNIFVNGEKKASDEIDGNFSISETELMIGKNNQPFIPYDPVRQFCEECHIPTIFGIDALVDEIKLYNKALSPSRIRESYKNYKPDTSIVNNPDMDARILPSGISTGDFAARYTKLKYYDSWDNLARFGDYTDIVVEFDELPTKFIFWRGTCYVPQIVNSENQWYNNQFNESWGEGGSCGEPMSDKQSKISHVRLIEDTPARKVVHWRYTQIQIDGTQLNYDSETGWGDWSDWYYYIYPDGVACKRMRHWSSDDPLNHEWQESIGVMGPGQTPESISHVYDKTVTLDDFKVTKSYDWGEMEDFVPLELEEDWERRPLKIQVVNYKSEYNPFTIADFKGGECYGDFDGQVAPYSNMVVYIHWPFGQLPTDGTRAVKPDRGSSNGYTHLMFRGSHRLGDNWAERVMLEGMTNKSAKELRTLAKSWLEPAKISNVSGASDYGYGQGQRAYVLSSIESEISFTLNGKEDRPVENPCFVIKNWGGEQQAKVKIDGQKVPQGSDFRQGVVLDTDGRETLVIWLKHQSGSTQNYIITKKDQQ